MRQAGFVAALRRCRAQGLLPVIPDIKCRSPKEGDLIRGRDPVVLARAYVDQGAPALSVVTEPLHFGGSLSLLASVARSVPVPVLRKDFIRQEREIQLSRQAGASAVLLIAAMLKPQRLLQLRRVCREEGLEVMVEINSEAELPVALAARPEMIGINNRDILHLETDSGEVSRTERLAPLIAGSALLVSESGLNTVQDARRASIAGAQAVLIGTALLQAKAPGDLLHDFAHALEDVHAG